jgi:hypothetical protein
MTRARNSLAFTLAFTFASAVKSGVAKGLPLPVLGNWYATEPESGTSMKQFLLAEDMVLES